MRRPRRIRTDRGSPGRGAGPAIAGSEGSGFSLEKPRRRRTAGRDIWGARYLRLRRKAWLSAKPDPSVSFAASSPFKGALVGTNSPKLSCSVGLYRPSSVSAAPSQLPRRGSFCAARRTARWGRLWASVRGDTFDQLFSFTTFRAAGSR